MSEGSHLYRWRFGDMQFDEARLELRVSGLPVDVEQNRCKSLPSCYDTRAKSSPRKNCSRRCGRDG